MALSTVTWKEIEAQVRAIAGATNYADPNTDTVRRWGNLVLQKMARLLTGVDKPWGRNTSTLTLLQDAGKLIDFNDGTFTLADFGLFKSGVSFDNTYIGGWAFVYNSSTQRAWYGIVDRLGTTNDWVHLRFMVGTAAAESISGSNLFAIIKPNPTYNNGANLSTLNLFDMVKIVDGTNGNVVRLDSDAFSTFANNPNYDSSVVAEFAGEAAFIEKGASVSSFGTLTLTYDEKPDSIASAATAIDLLPEHLQMFTEEVARYCLNYVGAPIPEQYQNPLGVLEAQYKRRAKELAMKRAQKFVPARRK